MIHARDPSHEIRRWRLVRAVVRARSTRRKLDRLFSQRPEILGASYVNGAKHGYFRRWNKNGQLIEENWFWCDALHGVWRKWDENGVEQLVGEFHFGFQDRDLLHSENRRFHSTLKPYLEIEPQKFEQYLPELLRDWQAKTVLLRKDERECDDLTPRGSYWNHVNVMRADEVWPAFNGKPLFPILQIYCAEIDVPDHPLANFAFVTLFSISDDIPQSFGHDIVLRTYRHDEELVVANCPIDPLEPPRRILVSEPYICYPDRNDWPPGLGVYGTLHLLPQALTEHEARFDTRWGGWPGWLQWGKISHHGDFAFQVDRLDIEKWRIGDSAICYFFYHPKTGDFSWQYESM